MQHLRPLLVNGDLRTPELARAALAAHPELPPILEGLSSQARFRLRAQLTGRDGVGPGVADVFVPRRVADREPTRWSPYGLPAPAVALVEAAGLDGDPESWVPAEANRAAAALVAHYAVPTTAAAMLTRLRAGLKGLVPEAAYEGLRNATFMPQTTAAANERMAAARAARDEAGVEAPERWTLPALRGRVAAWLEAPRASPEALADLMVVLSARPGEVETLEIGDRGGVPKITAGVLKKRVERDAYPIVSGLGPEAAERVLGAWRNLDPIERARAARALPAWLVHEVGPDFERRNLRAIGADLAVRAAEQRGEVANDVQAREVQRAALRHEAPPRAQALDHYARLNHTTRTIEAAIRDMSLAEREQLAALMRVMMAARAGGAPADPQG